MTPARWGHFSVFNIEIAASANPTIEVYDNMELTPLQTMTGDFSNATNALLGS